MDKDLDNSIVHNSTCLKDSDSDKSFVGKVKSIINNTPLSKWFRKQDDNRPVIRRRDEVFQDEEDISEIQPPSKRVKLPVDGERNSCNSTLFNEPCVSIKNNVSKNIFNKVPEPVAGPSGIKSNKPLGNATQISVNSARNTFGTKEVLNGHSDSEESTSGYSSVVRIGSKEQVCGSQESSKQPSPSQTSPSNTRSLFHKSSTVSNRSLFTDRTFSPTMNTSMSSRRPNFNASTFGSPNFVDKTISTKKITSSPFYNGKTIYGGASAYGRSLGRTSKDFKTSLRNSVDIKPINKTAENGNLVLGKTARRILDTIEQYSSPISDAKKIPVISRKSKHAGLITKYTGANPYMVRDTKVSSNKELQVPTVPDLLKMKSRLQESTETVRQIAASSKSGLNTEYYRISTREEEKDKHTGKIKTKVTSVRPKHQNEVVNEVNLTPVSLPITTLPKFDFVLPPPVSAKSISNSSSPITHQTSTSKSPKIQPRKVTQTEIHVQKETRTSTTTTVIEYKFSDPLVIAENIKSIVAINDFKFSEPPMCVKGKTDASKSTLNFKMPENKLPTFIPNKKASSEPVKTAPSLKTGSVMDVLGKKDSSEKESLLEKFKPAQGTWECSVCMIRNQSDRMRCAACETPKAGSVKPAENKSLLGFQFKTPSDKWECSSCMVPNKASDDKCVCCATPKPNAASSTKEVKTVTSGFGDQFKPSTDTWECGTCMIRNKSDLNKCAACETPNPKSKTSAAETKAFGKKTETSNGFTTQQSGFGSVFKVKNDEWECGTCMVRNKSSNTKCQCCETPNPNCSSSDSPALGRDNDKKPIPSFNFGIDKAASTSFSFGIPPSAAASSLPKTDNQLSIFGGTAKSTPSATVKFSFGIPAAAQDKPTTVETPSVKPPSTEASKPKETTSVVTSKALPKPEEKLPAKVETAKTDFKFGVSSSTTTLPSTNKETNVVKSDAPISTTNSTDNKKPIFGLKPATTSAEVKTPPFTFGKKPAAVAAPLVTTSQPSQSEPSKPIFKFGPTTTNSFGSPNPAPTSLNNGFGNTNTSTAAFGTPNTSVFDKLVTTSTEVKSFTFSSTTKDPTEPPSKTPMFSFGQTSTAPAPTEKTPGFNFGASSTTPNFNFSARKTETPSFNPTPANNMFGGSNPTTQNGMFNFGSMASSNSTQKAGFSFGAPVNNAGASGSQSGFNFGASASSFTPSTGGFNFSGAPPTFNANAKPSFNFTDGSVAAFLAQPAADGGVATPRKIKRAIRRAQR